MDVSSAGVPGIASNPESANVVEGQQTAFSVAATGTGLTYQWQYSTNGGSSFVNVAGANSPTHAFLAELTLNASLWRVIVTNSAGSTTSNAARLTVTASATIPAVTSDPLPQNVLEGETASFSVSASGMPSPSTQWQVRPGGLSQPEEGWVNIAGATGRTYTTPQLSLSKSGQQYRAILLNAAGSAISRAATLTVSQRLIAPSVLQQPTPMTLSAGQAGAFSVVAAGSSPLSYQWFKNGTAIVGANANAVMIPANVNEIGQTHQITVRVTNGVGGSTSNPAAMTVTAPPGVELVSAQMTAAEGGVLETSKSAALVVPAGALSANAKVTVLAQSADQVGLPADFIPIGDVVTIATGGVALTPNVTLNVPTPEIVEEGKVLALVELGDTAEFAGFGALNVQRLANGEAKSSRSVVMASTPALRVMCLNSSHERFGTTLANIDRIGRYQAGQVPESACTEESPRPSNAQVHSTSTAPCRENEFVSTSEGSRAGLISRHVYCETGSTETGFSEWVTINEVSTLKDYGRHRLEYRLGTDGPAKSLGVNVRLRFRLVRVGPGSTNEEAKITVRPKIACDNSELYLTACSHKTAEVSVSTGSGWSSEVLVPVKFTWSRELNQHDKYAFSQVELAYALPSQKIAEEPQRLYIGQPPTLRCDKGMAVNGGTGCVYSDYPAVMLIALSDSRWSDAAQHIKDAQAWGAPGALKSDGQGRLVAGIGQAMRRSKFESVIDANRKAACSSVASSGSLWLTRLPQQRSARCSSGSAICSCDEYPFAATWNGASINPAQTSVRHILASQNSLEGTLHGVFFQYERVLDFTSSADAGTSQGGDDFWVHVD